MTNNLSKAVMQKLNVLVGPSVEKPEQFADIFLGLASMYVPSILEAQWMMADICGAAYLMPKTNGRIVLIMPHKDEEQTTSPEEAGLILTYRTVCIVLGGRQCKTLEGWRDRLRQAINTRPESEAVAWALN